MYRQKMIQTQRRLNPAHLRRRKMGHNHHFISPFKIGSQLYQYGPEELLLTTYSFFKLTLLKGAKVQIYFYKLQHNGIRTLKLKGLYKIFWVIDIPYKLFHGKHHKATVQNYLLNGKQSVTRKTPFKPLQICISKGKR